MANRLLAALGRGGRGAPERERIAERFGPLTREQLLALAAGPLDGGMLKAAVHVIRAEGARAARSLAEAGTRGLTDGQVREECGALAAAGRIESALLGLVEQANKRMANG
jgi:hypothetical protein